MSTTITDPYTLDARQIAALLNPGLSLLPELEAARHDVAGLRAAPAVQAMLTRSAPLLADPLSIPQTRYTDYRLFHRTGDRDPYEAPYFRKRQILAVAVLRLFLGQAEHQDTVQDYIWSICEESNWVVPGHERSRIALFAAWTGLLLAETLNLVGAGLDSEVCSRVRSEVEARIFTPYLRYGQLEAWYCGHNNWNGVCNSLIAATFLWLEPEQGRVAEALVKALVSLRVYVETAFAEDGSSDEGVGYWHYGLFNLFILAEMLYARSGGALNLLNTERMRRIAAYPAKVLLSGSNFANFADCEEAIHFHAGIMTRLAERTNEDSLRGALAGPVRFGGELELEAMLRDALWWQESRHSVSVCDAVLPAGGIARLTSRTGDGTPLIMVVKAGHNAENHNHNDLGSLVIHADGETFLADPGPGHYNGAYFGARRYENIFASSYGHSLPRIGGHQQGAGREFHSTLLAVETQQAAKLARLDLTHAYPVSGLERLIRTISLVRDQIVLTDEFAFGNAPQEVEEVLVTWLETNIAGPVALIQGNRHVLRLTIEQPTSAQPWRMEGLEEDCRANGKPGVLTRLSFVVPAAQSAMAQVRMVLST